MYHTEEMQPRVVYMWIFEIIRSQYYSTLNPVPAVCSTKETSPTLLAIWTLLVQGVKEHVENQKCIKSNFPKQNKNVNGIIL